MAPAGLPVDADLTALYRTSVPVRALPLGTSMFHEAFVFGSSSDEVKSRVRRVANALRAFTCSGEEPMLFVRGAPEATGGMYYALVSAGSFGAKPRAMRVAEIVYGSRRLEE